MIPGIHQPLMDDWTLDVRSTGVWTTWRSGPSGARMKAWARAYWDEAQEKEEAPFAMEFCIFNPLGRAVWWCRMEKGFSKRMQWKWLNLPTREGFRRSILGREEC